MRIEYYILTRTVYMLISLAGYYCGTGGFTEDTKMLRGRISAFFGGGRIDFGGLFTSSKPKSKLSRRKNLRIS